MIGVSLVAVALSPHLRDSSHSFFWRGKFDDPFFMVQSPFIHEYPGCSLEPLDPWMFCAGCVAASHGSGGRGAAGAAGRGRAHGLC